MTTIVSPCKLSSDFESALTLEDILSIGDMDPADFTELINKLKQEANFYAEETARMEADFARMGLLNDQNELPTELDEILEKMCQLQEEHNTKELSTNAVVLSHSHRIRKHSKYLSVMKLSLKMYVNLNEVLSQKIKELRKEYKQCQKKIEKVFSIKTDEIKVMEKKVDTYERELNRMEKKYPWLKNSEYNMPNISKEISSLTAARLERDELLKELNCYHGLKPDLTEAIEQLSQIKKEHAEIDKKLMETNK